MKAILCKKFGDFSEISFETIDEPSFGENDVLISVHIATVSHMDWLMTNGKYHVSIRLKIALIDTKTADPFTTSSFYELKVIGVVYNAAKIRIFIVNTQRKPLFHLKIPGLLNSFWRKA